MVDDEHDISTDDEPIDDVSLDEDTVDESSELTDEIEDIVEKGEEVLEDIDEGNIEEAVKDSMDLLKEFDDLHAKLDSLKNDNRIYSYILIALVIINIVTTILLR